MLTIRYTGRILVTQFHAIFRSPVLISLILADLQYLDWSDFCRYVQSLDRSREHLVNDPSYLRIFHQENLILRKGEGKKESGYVAML